ncbi:hypothetical protein ACFLW2_00135 [Chloroflexota bacterium]
MREEELIGKLEKVDLSGIEGQSHRDRLRADLLRSAYSREKPGRGFPGLAGLKMILPQIARRPAWQKALATVLVVAMIIGAGSVVLLGPTSSWEGVSDKAYAATMGVESFHFESSTSDTIWHEGMQVYENPDMQWIMAGDFLAPDRMKWTQWTKDGQKLGEVRIIGDKKYEWNSETGEWVLWPWNPGVEGDTVQELAGYAQPVSIAEMLKEIKDVEELPDEVIDGVNCLHYRGKWDVLKDMREEMEKETDPAIKASLQKQLELNEQNHERWGTTFTMEFWIGEGDYLVRQQRLITSSKGTPDEFGLNYNDIQVPADAIVTKSMTSTVKFSRFDEPVEIEAPSGVVKYGAGDPGHSGWGPGGSYASNEYLAVWGSSSTDVFTVGGGGTILYCDGDAWRPMGSGTTEDLRDVWGSSASDVFAVGGSGTILHYDGSAWDEMSSGTTDELLGVWGSSSSDVFAVGVSGTILHYDGSTWSEMASGTTGHLNGIWGSSSSDIFAVGNGGTIIYYNGSTWSVMDSSSTEQLVDVWGRSASDVFAVGAGGILHYDGSTWSAWNPGGNVATSSIEAIYGSSPSDIYVVVVEGPVYHYDGSSWDQRTSSGETLFRDIWVSPSNEVFTIGYDYNLPSPIILQSRR